MKKLLLTIALVFGLSAAAHAGWIATIDSTNGRHYDLWKIGSIYELQGVNGFIASGIWAGNVLTLEGPNGCRAEAILVGNRVDWTITDPTY
jgi:hypothetical protein